MYWHFPQYGRKTHQRHLIQTFLPHTTTGYPRFHARKRFPSSRSGTLQPLSMSPRSLPIQLRGPRIWILAKRSSSQDPPKSARPSQCPAPFLSPHHHLPSRRGTPSSPEPNSSVAQEVNPGFSLPVRTRSVLTPWPPKGLNLPCHSHQQGYFLKLNSASGLFRSKGPGESKPVQGHSIFSTDTTCPSLLVKTN